MKFSVILLIVCGIVIASSNDVPKKREKRTIILSSILRALILKEAALGTALNFIQSPQINSLFPIPPLPPRTNIRQSQARNQATSPAPPTNSTVPPMMVPNGQQQMTMPNGQPMMPTMPPMMPATMPPTMPPMMQPMMPANQPAQMTPQNGQVPQPDPNQMVAQAQSVIPGPMQIANTAQQPLPPQDPSQQQPAQPQDPSQQQPAQPQAQPAQPQPADPSQTNQPAIQQGPPANGQPPQPPNPPQPDQGQQVANAQPAGLPPAPSGPAADITGQAIDLSAGGGSIDAAGAITGPGANTLLEISGQAPFSPSGEGAALSFASQGLAGNIGRSSVFGANQITPETSQSFVSLPNGYQFTNTQNEHYLPSSNSHLSSFHNNFETFPRNYHYQYLY